MARIVRAAALGCLVLAVAGCWPMPGQNPDRTAYNSGERALTGATVRGLQERWRWHDPAPYEGAVHPPVLSPAGVLAAGLCTATMLAPSTGVQRWQQSTSSIPQDPSGFFTECWELQGVGEFVSGEPAAVRVAGRDLALVGTGWLIAYKGGHAETSQAYAFDAATGAHVGVPGIEMDGVPSALRSSRVLGLRQGADELFDTSVHLSVSDLGTPGSRRSAVIGWHDSLEYWNPGRVTAGTDLVFHAGDGSLATAPGDPAWGPGLRALSYALDRPGCGPWWHGWDPGVHRTVECPVWVNRLDGSAATSTPMLSGGGEVVYVRSDAGGTFAIDGATGATRWSAPTGPGDDMALAGDLLYVPTRDGRVLGLSVDGCGAARCAALWSADTGTGEPAGPPTVAGDVVYVGSAGRVFAFARDGCGAPRCTPLWSADTGDAPVRRPVVANGQLYVASGATLVAYGLRQ
jgi:PQQ-like domain